MVQLPRALIMGSSDKQVSAHGSRDTALLRMWSHQHVILATPAVVRCCSPCMKSCICLTTATSPLSCRSFLSVFLRLSAVERLTVARSTAVKTRI